MLSLRRTFKFSQLRFLTNRGFSTSNSSRFRLVSESHCLTRPMSLTTCLRPTSLSLYRYAATLSPPGDSPSKELREYSPPTSGLLSLLPPSWVPYAELTRIDKPTGTIYLLVPTLWSTIMAASMMTPVAPVSSVLYTSALFTTGAVLMRGAGCCINDLWDRNIDNKVARTRLRPLARRAITPTDAIIFTGAQLLAALGILVQFPAEVIYSTLPSMFVVIAYPAMKRVTNYPQVVLGMAFSWGAFIGFPAMGLTLLEPTTAVTGACLYASNVAWTVLYDTVYAHQDIKDDKKAGVMSTAIANEGRTRLFLSALAAAQVSLLAGAGVAAGFGPAYFVWSCGGAAVGLGWMIRRADFKDAADCWRWFKWCAWAIGGFAIGGGITAEYALRKWAEEKEETQLAV